MKLNLLHVSDLHFGENSIITEAFSSIAFEDFFSLIKSQIYDVIVEKEIQLLIVSGDISTKGNKQNYNNKYLLSFLEIFQKRNIPIIICNGNHDLNWDLIEKNNQFTDYVNFINSNFNLLNVEKSRNFSNNQVLYYYFETHNTILIAYNSCKYIEKRVIDEKIKDFIDDKKKINKFLQQEYLNKGIISRKDLDETFKEFENKFGSHRFKQMNKFIICHHGLEFQSGISLNFLIDNDVRIVFSGHIHKNRKIKQSDKNLINYVAGSFLGKRRIRDDSINFTINPLQFNCYSIDFRNKKIETLIYEYNTDSRWESKKQKTEKIDLIRTHYSVENWCNSNGCEKFFDMLTAKHIELIIEDSDVSDFEMIDKKSIRIYGWIIRNTDTQVRVDLINKWIADNYIGIYEKDFEIIILNLTNKYKMQFPKKYTYGIETI